MGSRAKVINKIVFFIALLWSLLLLIFVSVFIAKNYRYADDLALHEAIVSTKKDLAYRSWVASHGGVYVPVTERTPPNPYLSHIAKRDIETTTGDKLTLMNPAYTLSQMMHDYTKLYGTKGHITSKILLNPKNKPDSWEEKALDTIEITREPSYEKAMIDGEEYYRYLKPLVTQKACLKCHAFQGYKVGDIRGGVSVSIPMKPFYAEAYKQSLLNVAVFFLLWVLGLVAIFYGRQKAREALEDKIKDYEQHIYSLVTMIEKRDRYTAGHTQRVANYSILIAEYMGYNEEKIDELYRACMLHDIGKISTPDSILLKPGKLSALEYSIIQEHVVTSYEILKDIDIYRDIAQIVRHHHEHYDGSGYPQGLKGDEIPMLSHIMAVADAFDAMTTDRIYKGRKSVDVALDEIKSLGGAQFHSEVAEAAFNALRGVEIDTRASQRPETKLEKERFVYFYKDQTTGAFNQEYLESVLSYNHQDKHQYSCINVVYLRHFTQFNQRFGWSKGDEMLHAFASELQKLYPASLVFRLYGDDFLILHKKHHEFSEHLEALEKFLEGSGIEIFYKHIDMQAQKLNEFKDLEVIL